MSANIESIQKDLRAAKLTAGSSMISAAAIPSPTAFWPLPEGMRTAAVFYFVPAKGAPKKLVHKIEAQSLATLPGDTLYFSAARGMRGKSEKNPRSSRNVAMQYSPKNAIPYVSMVDAGTIELVRRHGCEKSPRPPNLVQKYEACWSNVQLDSHLAAGRAIDRIVQQAFAFAAQSVAKERI